jgi:hypothetical protein
MDYLKILKVCVFCVLTAFISSGCGTKENVKDQNKEQNKEPQKESIKDGPVSIDKPLQIKYDMNFKNQLIKKISITIQKKKYVYFAADFNNNGIQSNTLTVYNDGNDNIFVINYFDGNKSGAKFKLADLNNLLKDSAILVFDRLYNKKLLDRMTDTAGTEKYLNISCDVYNFQIGGVNGKFFINKNFVMMGADFAEGKLTLKATAFDSDAAIDENIFKIPSDTEYKDGLELINKYNQKEVKKVRKDDSWIVNDMIFLPGLDAVKLLFAE